MASAGSCGAFVGVRLPGCDGVRAPGRAAEQKRRELVSRRPNTRRLQRAQVSASVEDDLGLTPELGKLTRQLKTVPDAKLRYQQLLFMAQALAPMEERLKTAENKVPGCLSVVHVHATAQDGKVFFEGDSDAQLTKGLVAILVKGLSGNSAADIERVSPEFIKESGLSVALTPGRNNGFLNMLAKMKQLAAAVVAEGDGAADESAEGEAETAAPPTTGGPTMRIMHEKLAVLKASVLEIEDDSDKHAGHVGARPEGETHFRVRVVSAAFEGLASVKRHQVIYALLAEEMQNGVHALQIEARAPSEVGPSPATLRQ